MKSFATKIAGQVSQLSKKEVEDEYGILKSVLALGNYQMIASGSLRCQGKLLPAVFLDVDKLYYRLFDLKLRLERHNKALAIRLDNFDQYFKIPIADCVKTGTKVAVIINVPIRRRDNDWRLYKLHHSKFAFMNQTCSIYPMDNHFLARSSRMSVLITSEMLSHCTVYDHGLCLVPEHTRDTSESVSCAVGLAVTRPISELRKLQCS